MLCGQRICFCRIEGSLDAVRRKRSTYLGHKSEEVLFIFSDYDRLTFTHKARNGRAATGTDGR